jgi:hypothetical protein
MILSENLYELIPCLYKKEIVYNKENIYNNNSNSSSFSNNTIKRNKLSFDNLDNLSIKKIDLPIKEIIHKKQKYTEVSITYLINNDIKLDNLLCSYCINGDITNIIFLIINKGVDPFKFNKLYQTNPLHLAIQYNHLNIIKIIQKYVYDKKIPYNFNFFCPFWGSKELNQGQLNFQTRIFQSLFNTILEAFWSLEIKQWVQF